MGRVIIATLMGSMVLAILFLLSMVIALVFEFNFVKAFIFTILFLIVSFLIGVCFVWEE